MLALPNICIAFRICLGVKPISINWFGSLELAPALDTIAEGLAEGGDGDLRCLRLKICDGLRAGEPRGVGGT